MRQQRAGEHNGRHQQHNASALEARPSLTPCRVDSARSALLQALHHGALPRHRADGQELAGRGARGGARSWLFPPGASPWYPLRVLRYMQPERPPHCQPALPDAGWCAASATAAHTRQVAEAPRVAHGALHRTDAAHSPAHAAHNPARAQHGATARGALGRRAEGRRARRPRVAACGVRRLDETLLRGSARGRAGGGRRQRVTRPPAHQRWRHPCLGPVGTAIHGASGGPSRADKAADGPATFWRHERRA